MSSPSSALLEINAIKFAPEYSAFTWVSGLQSPIYCDNRVIFSYVDTRDYFKSLFVKAIKTHYPSVNCIAGVATGGIPMGALVADALKIPFIYVRATSKKYGLKKQIEGAMKDAYKVVIMEDHISTGKSSLEAVNALRKENIKILGLIAVFSYGFDKTASNFKEADVPFRTLTNYNDLLKEAEKKGAINANYLSTLKQWQKAPDLWKPTPHPKKIKAL